MAVSVSEMATNPRPSSESPTMTIRLTRSAEPRSLRRRRFLRLIRFMTQLLVARVRVGSGAALPDQIAVLGDAYFTGDGVVEANFAQRLCRSRRIIRLLVLPAEGDGQGSTCRNVGDACRNEAGYRAGPDSGEVVGGSAVSDGGQGHVVMNRSVADRQAPRDVDRL